MSFNYNGNGSIIPSYNDGFGDPNDDMEISNGDIEEKDSLVASVDLNYSNYTVTINVDLTTNQTADDECYIQDQGKIAVSSFIQKKIQVFVKTLRGNTVTCDLTNVSRVKDLEREAYHKSGVPAEQQRLVFAGRNLDGRTNKPLTDYGITNQSTVYMMGRLRGG